MKKYAIAIIVTVFILVDLCVILYPTVSDYMNSKSQSRAVAHYIDEVAVMDDEEMNSMLQAAHTYNADLLSKTERFDFTDEETAEYKRQLAANRSTIGVLVIDAIDVKLAIYQGTDEGILQVGLGHVQGTSLPVGGVGTHAFITGHRGLPSSKLLTDLDKLVIGDTFVLHVMGETLTYQVDEIKTVEPDDVGSTAIDPEMDYCTLLTCTPYGVNTHRLLVRGHRVENSAGVVWETLHANATWLDPLSIIMICVILVLPGLIIYFTVKCIKLRKEGAVQL